MDQARNGRRLLAATVLGATIAIGVITMNAPATYAVAPASMPAAEGGGNGPTGYFPAQFVNQGTEVAEHIEAF